MLVLYGNCRRGGNLRRSPGSLRATPAGKELLAGAPERIDMKLLDDIPAYSGWRTQSPTGTQGYRI